MMPKFNIYLTRKQVERLNDVVNITGLSKVEIMSRAFDLYYNYFIDTMEKYD